MTKVEAYTEWLENLANDNSHGYSQTNRWGPDYDCSSGVIAALEYAGFPMKAYGASYTGNMRQALLRCGFKDVTSGINLATGTGLKRGDICLNERDHVAVYIGNGKVVNIRSSDGHPEPGDQTGNEIRIQSYWNYPWDCVMRYPETISDDTEEPVLAIDGICGTETWAALISEMPTIEELPVVKYGSMDWSVAMCQSMLNYLGAGLDTDGECGPKTKAAIMNFQREYNGRSKEV